MIRFRRKQAPAPASRSPEVEEALACIASLRQLAREREAAQQRGNLLMVALLAGQLTLFDRRVELTWPDGLPPAVTPETLAETLREHALMLLPTTRSIAGKIRELRDIQSQHGTWNASGYMRGLHNGLELALSILEGEREPQFKDAPGEEGYLCERSTPDLSGPEYAPVPAEDGEG